MSTRGLGGRMLIAAAGLLAVTSAMLAIEMASRAQSKAAAQTQQLAAEPPNVPAAAGPPTVNDQPSLEALLAANQLDFAKQDGIYHVVLSNDVQSVKVTCGEATMYRDENSRPVKMIWLWTQIAVIPKNKAPSVALLLKIAEINDGLRPGNVSFNRENGGLYYNSSFWLDTTTPPVIYDELAYAFHRQAELQKLLLPFLSEE